MEYDEVIIFVHNSTPLHFEEEVAREYSPAYAWTFFNLLIWSPFVLHAGVCLYDNYDIITDYTNGIYNSVCAWAKGVQRYDRNKEKVFEPLHEEPGSKYVNQNGRNVVVEGYFMDDKLHGPGNVNIYEKERWVESKGMYRNNKLNGPGTYEVGERKYGEWIEGTYTGTFKNNNLHGKGKFENDYICVEGEFNNGYIQEGTIQVKEYNEFYMDPIYEYRTEIIGVFSGKDRLSQTAYVDCVHLNGRGEMTLKKDGNSIIEYGHFREGRLHGEGKSVFKVDESEYEVFSFYQNGAMGSTRTIMNNGVELRVNDMGFEFIYKDGTLNVDKELETFKLTFTSGDMVIGDVLNKKLMKIRTRVSKYPISNLNPDELKEFVYNTIKSDYVFCKDREVNDLSSLEFMYWLMGNNRELFNEVEDQNLDGETYLKLEKLDVTKEKENSEDSFVVVSD